MKLKKQNIFKNVNSVIVSSSSQVPHSPNQLKKLETTKVK